LESNRGFGTDASDIEKLRMPTVIGVH